MSQSKLVVSLGDTSFADLRVKFADAIARRDVSLARACQAWLCSSNDGANAERMRLLLTLECV